MTARNERAVRDAPGGAPDRRGADGDRKDAVQGGRTGSSSTSSAIPGLAAPQRDLVELRSTSLERGITTDPAISGGRAVSTRSGDSPVAAGREARSVVFPIGRLVRKDPVARASNAHAYSALYELEQHRGSFEILFLLLWEGEATLWRMRSVLRPGPQALKAALEALKELGLIEPTGAVRESAFPFGKPYRLSGRGKALLATQPDHWFAQGQR